MTVAERIQGRLLLNAVVMDGGHVVGDAECTACLLNDTFQPAGCP